MDAEGFRAWLERGYVSPRTGTALGKRPAGDAVSRCRRIEERLRIDLDRETQGLADPEELVTRIGRRVEGFRIQGDEAAGLASLQSALRLYAAYARSRRGS